MLCKNDMTCPIVQEAIYQTPYRITKPPTTETVSILILLLTKKINCGNFPHSCQIKKHPPPRKLNTALWARYAEPFGPFSWYSGSFSGIYSYRMKLLNVVRLTSVAQNVPKPCGASSKFQFFTISQQDMYRYTQSKWAYYGKSGVTKTGEFSKKLFPIQRN